MAHPAEILISADDAATLSQLLADRNAAEQAHDARDALADKLSDAQIVPERLLTRTVRLHARVTYEELPAGATRAVVIVNPRDADPDRGHISVLSPIGRALLGNAIGAVIEVPLPADRSLLVRVTEIEPAAATAIG